MATGKELAQGFFNEHRSLLLDDTRLSYDSVKDSLPDFIRTMSTEARDYSSVLLSAFTRNSPFRYFKISLRKAGIEISDDILVQAVVADNGQGEDNGIFDVIISDAFKNVLLDATAANELARLIETGAAATSSTFTPSLAGKELAQAVFNANRSLLLDDTRLSFDSVKDSLPDFIRTMSSEARDYSSVLLSAFTRNSPFRYFKISLRKAGIEISDDILVQAVVADNGQGEDNGIFDVIISDAFKNVLLDEIASNELVRLIETEGVSTTAASVSTGTPTSPTGTALAKAVFDANKGVLLRTDTLGSIRSEMPGALRVFADHEILVIENDAEYRILRDYIWTTPRYLLAYTGFQSSPNFIGLLAVDNPLRELFRRDDFGNIIRDKDATKQLAQLIEAGVSTTGSSPAETLFTANKDLLLRTNTLGSIRSAMPGALRVFASEDIIPASEVEARIIRGYILGSPRYLLYLPEFVSNPDFIGILSVDDPLRTLFSSDAFTDVLQDATAANELARLIEAATPAVTTPAPPPPAPEPALTAPTLMIGDIKTTTVALSWTAVPTATGYEYRYQVGSTWGGWTSTGTSTTVTVSGLSEGTAYRFQVRALRDSTKGPVSSARSAETEETPAPPPAVTPPTPLPDLTAPTVTPDQSQADSDSFPISWTAVNTAKGYEYRIRTGFGTWGSWRSTGSTDTEHTIQNLDPYTLYFLHVRAVRDGTKGPTSSVVAFYTRSEPLSAPTLLSPIIGVTSVTLRWLVDIAEGATGYEYAFATGPADFGDWMPTPETEVEVTGLEESTLYRFKVRAVRNDDRSDDSNIVSATTGSPLPAPVILKPQGQSSPFLISGPTIASVVPVPDTPGPTVPDPPVAPPISLTRPVVGQSEVTTNSVTLRWNPVATATGYEYRYRENIAGWGPWIATSDTEAVVSGLNEGTLYYFRLRAVRGDTKGPLRHVRLLTDIRIPPEAPTLLMPAAGVDQVYVKWTPVENADSYEYRYRQGEMSWSDWISTDKTEIVVTGLSQNTSYSFQSRAIGGRLPSPESNIQTALTSVSRSAPSAGAPAWSQGQQWGEQRRYTLQDMMAQLRMALSEPHAGSWGTVVYDIDNDFAPDVSSLENVEIPLPSKYAVNELAYMLNLAQVETVRDLYERGFAFSEVTHQEPISAGMDFVSLPGDFMAIESVFHRCERDKRRVDRASLKGLQDTRVEDSYAYSDRFFCYYEVRGNIGETITSGQVLPEDVVDVDDQLRLPASEIGKVSAGDLVLNQTDGCGARVLEVNVGARVLLLERLSGGRTDTFEALDFYAIQSAAQPFEMMHLWPHLKQVRETTVYSGKPHGWQVKDWVCPTRLRFRIDSLPKGLHPRKSRIYVAIQEDTDTSASEPIFEEAAGGGLTADIKKGWNEVDLHSFDDFSPDKQYYVTVMTNDYNRSSKTGFALVPERVEVYAAVPDNYLEITYTRLPVPLLSPDAVCELPQYIVPCIIAYAKVLAYLKKTGMVRADPGLLAEYESLVVKNLRFLRKRGESGISNVFMNPSRSNRNRRFGGNYVPSGWTNIVRF